MKKKQINKNKCLLQPNNNSNFPTFQIMLSKRYGKFGKFAFTAHTSGQHFLCFKTNSTSFSVFARERLVRNVDTQNKCYSKQSKIHKRTPRLNTD